MATVLFTLQVREKAPPLPDSAVLMLDMTQLISEYSATQSIFQEQSDATVLDIVLAIEAAAHSPNVKGLAMELGSGTLGFAKAQELADAVRAFRQSGKPAYLFARDIGSMDGGLPEGILAASFDQVWMPPSGIYGLTGVAFEIPYMAEGLDELGVTAEFEQRHEFKGGADPFTQRRMSVPVRRSLSQLANDLLTQSISSVAQDENQDVAAIRDVVSQSPLLVRDAEALGLVDRIAYYQDFQIFLEGEFGTENERVDPIFLLSSLGANNSIGDRDSIDQTEVAVVYGVGPIGASDSDGPFDDTGFNASGVVETLDQIVENRYHDAVIFRIESPGGAYGPSDEVWQAVERVKGAGIPVIVSMGDIAGSGGYFVAAGADHILAQPGTITGSIGVYGGKFDASRFWTSIGVNWDQVTAGDNAGMWTMNRPFDAAERERFATLIDFVYEDFTRKVAAGRSLDATQLDAVARGRLWSGEEALEVGLVDSLGGYIAAFQKVREFLNLGENARLSLTILPEPIDPIEKIAEAIAEGDFMASIESLIASRVEQRVRTRLEPMIGNPDFMLTQTGLLSTPPFRMH